MERFAELYRLSAHERDAVLLLLMMHVGSSDLWLQSGVCGLREPEEGADSTLLRTLCGLSAVGVAHFMDAERAHVEDGAVLYI